MVTDTKYLVSVGNVVNGDLVFLEEYWFSDINEAFHCWQDSFDSGNNHIVLSEVKSIGVNPGFVDC